MFYSIKGDRHSVGYKRSNVDFNFTEHTINVKNGDKFYIATDGIIDQAGGEKEFPFGNKKLIKILENIHNEKFCTQKRKLISEINEHMKDTEQTDDLTILGFKI